MSDYKKITTEDLSLNPFKRIAKDWMLITCLLYTSDAADE